MELIDGSRATNKKLDEYANEQGGTSVSVKLSVKAQEEGQIDADLQNRISMI